MGKLKLIQVRKQGWWQRWGWSRQEMWRKGEALFEVTPDVGEPFHLVMMEDDEVTF